MTLEQLQSMSDTKLNRIAAVQILWGGIVNVPSDDWKPTEDMNDAMKLADVLRLKNKLLLRLETTFSDQWYAVFQSSSPQKYTLATDSNPARAITIAAILAMEE